MKQFYFRLVSLLSDWLPNKKQKTKKANSYRKPSSSDSYKSHISALKKRGSFTSITFQNYSTKEKKNL